MKSNSNDKSKKNVFYTILLSIFSLIVFLHITNIVPLTKKKRLKKEIKVKIRSMVNSLKLSEEDKKKETEELKQIIKSKFLTSIQRNKFDILINLYNIIDTVHTSENYKKIDNILDKLKSNNLSVTSIEAEIADIEQNVKNYYNKIILS